MSIDVFAGSLTLYYLGAWKTVAQQNAESNNMAHMTIRAPRAQESELDEDGIIKVVAAWTESTCEALSEHMGTEIYWKEGIELTEYFSEGTSWEGLRALSLWAAYNEFPEQAKSDPDLNAEDNELLAAAADENYDSCYKQIIRPVELWLPCDLPFTYTGEDLTYSMITIGSAHALNRELADLNRRTWRAEESEIQEWLSLGDPGLAASFERFAKFAFSIMWASSKFSIEHRAPMKLDY